MEKSSFIGLTFKWIIPLLVIILGVLLSAKTDILKDSCDNCDERPYSFSKTQLMWWSMIILSCFSIAFGVQPDNIPEPSTAMLVLLGISIGTTAAGQMIDSSDKNNPQVLRRFQEEGKKGRGFLQNLLRDKNGVSISRFQALFFNLIFGIIFIIQFFPEATTFPDFDTMALGLMGISSSAFVGIKINENA
ncbi:hypothetical protein [Spongiimicrobium salis]|uniref:hypothetical protein n=1 Tax=Spongiimicrobium salis TaxID=1667022 RepID=UPI00374CCF9E